MNFTGFADWSLDEIASKTGLSKISCKKAAARQFSEPGLWSGTADDLVSYKAWLADHGVKPQRGGRFITHSFGADKTKRMAQVSDCYRSRLSTMKTLARRDSAVVALHDCDILTYTKDILTRLIYPVARLA